MESILYKIYSGDYDTTRRPDKKQQETDDKRFTEWDRVQRVFGDEFMDRLFALEAEREDEHAFHYYREGFRLGVCLMLEVFMPA